MKVIVDSQKFDKVLKNIRNNFATLEAIKTAKTLDTFVSMVDDTLIFENGIQGFYLKQTLKVEVTEPLISPFVVDAAIFSQLSFLPESFNLGWDLEKKVITINAGSFNVNLQPLQISPEIIIRNRINLQDERIIPLWHTTFDDIRKYCDLPQVFSKADFLPMKLSILSDKITVIVADDFCGAYYTKQGETGVDPVEFIIPNHVIINLFKDKFKAYKNESNEDIVDKRVTVRLGKGYIVFDSTDFLLAHPLLQIKVVDTGEYIDNKRKTAELLSFKVSVAEMLGKLKTIVSILKKDEMKTNRLMIRCQDNNLVIHTAGVLGEASDRVEVSSVYTPMHNYFFNMSAESIIKFISMFDEAETIQVYVWRGVVLLENDKVRYIVPQLS